MNSQKEKKHGHEHTAGCPYQGSRRAFQGLQAAQFESSLRIYRQFIPIRVGEDEDPEAYVPPEPYIQVKLADGELNDRDERQAANVVLMIGVCDHDPNRQGYSDALNIVEMIKLHYGVNGVFGKSFEVETPIRWAISEEDTHPYYYAAVGFSVSAPAIYREGVET